MNLLQALNEKVAHMGRELAKAHTTIYHQRIEIGHLRRRLIHSSEVWENVQRQNTRLREKLQGAEKRAMPLITRSIEDEQ